MSIMRRSVVSAVLAAVLGAASVFVAAQTGVGAPPPVASTVVALAAGTVGAGGPGSEPVAFVGQASITGKVIYDPDFGAPAMMQLSVDLSGVTGKGLRTGRTYKVGTQAILQRPLVAFDAIDVGMSFAADSNMTAARAAMASFSVQYNAATGLKVTPVRIATVPPG